MGRRGPPDLSRNVLRFSTPATITRFGASTNTGASGYFEASPKRECPILAHIWDGPRTVAPLEAGKERTRTVQGHTVFHVDTDVRGTLPGDHVTQGGITYEVRSVGAHRVSRDGNVTWYEFSGVELPP